MSSGLGRQEPRRVAGRWAAIDSTRALAGVAAVAVLATTGLTGAPASAPAAGLRPFADCAAFTSYMRGQAAAEGERMVRWLHIDAYARYGYIDGLAGPTGLQTEPMPDELYPEGPARASDPGVQPAEQDTAVPDEVAVDGTRVLTLAQSQRGPFLRVVEVAGGSPRVAGRVRLPYRGEGLLLLDDHRVLVVSSFEAGWPGMEAPWRTPQTVLMLVDVGEPARPVLLRTEKLTGHLVSARLRDGVLRLVVDSPIRPPGLPPFPRGPRELAAAQARDAGARASTRNLLPMRQILDGAGRLVGAGPLLRCVDVLAPAAPTDAGILSVLTIDTRGGPAAFDHVHGIGVLGDGDLVHAAGDRLYVAAEDGPDRTRIHALGTGSKNGTAYLTTVRLPGRAVRDGSLSVRDGLLRVATHEPGPTVLRVLAEREGRLEVVAATEGLGWVPQDVRPAEWFGRFASLTARHLEWGAMPPGQLVDLGDPRRPIALGPWRDYHAVQSVGGGRLLAIWQPAPRVALRAVLLDAAGPGIPHPLGELTLGSGWAGAPIYLAEAGLAVVPATLMEPPVPGSPIRKRRVMHYVALAIAVGADGSLRSAGRVLRGTDIHRVVRAGGYLVLVAGSSQTVVDPDGMRVLGTLRTSG